MDILNFDLYKILNENKINGINSILCVIYIYLSLFNKNKLINYNLENIYKIINNDIVNKILNNNKININLSNINSYTLINSVYNYHVNNEKLSIVKTYSSFYNNNLLVDYIINIVQPKINNNILESIFDGNVKINSYFDCIINKYTNIDWTKNNLYGVQNNKYIEEIIKLNLYIKTNQKINNNIINDNILLNGCDSHDLIFLDFPTDVHNLIHAKCCNKIKKLKIRGTKSDSLLLQLVMTSLNKNGRACLIVPDSLFFSDSIQLVETRKYLLENFNVKQIIEIDPLLYNNGIKSSILYFEDNTETTIIKYSKLVLNNDIINESELINININEIKNNNYFLYYKLYINKMKEITNIKYKNIDDLFYIDDYNIKPQIDSKIIVVPIYYNDNIEIKIENKYINNHINLLYKNLTDFNFEYLYYYFKTIIINNYDKLTTGKMKKFDINKLKNIKISELSLESQKTICNYFSITNNIIDNNNININNNYNLQKKIIDTIPHINMIELNKIIMINDEIHDFKYNYITICKNSLSAGSVNIIKNEYMLSQNLYYLSISNNLFLLDYVYYYLKINEYKLKELSNLTPQPSLNKNNLLSFTIPQISIDNQQSIIDYCNTFENNINKYNIDNENIKNKDIINVILKLYNF